jgi:hypothetical protein
MSLSRTFWLVFIAFVGANIGIATALNRAGMCISEQRWLKDSEYLSIAQKYAFDYMLSSALYDEKNKSEVNEVPSRWYKMLQYVAVDDFVSDHPNCCAISGFLPGDRTMPDGETVDFTESLLGYAGKMVVVSYMAEIKIEGKMVNKSVGLEVPMTTCGVPWFRD